VNSNEGVGVRQTVKGVREGGQGGGEKKGKGPLEKCSLIKATLDYHVRRASTCFEVDDGEGAGHPARNGYE